MVDIEHEEGNDVEAGVVQAIEDCAAEKEILQALNAWDLLKDQQ